MKISMRFVTSLLLGFSLSSCESKFEERDPVGNSGNAEVRREFTLKAHDIQERLSKAQDLIDGLNTFLKKFENKELGKVGYSDLLIQIMESVEASPVEKKSESYTSWGEIYLPTPGLSHECRTIRTMSVFKEEKESAHHSLFIQTCKTHGEFKKIATLLIEQKSKVSIVREKNIESYLPKLDLQQFVSAQGCEIERTESQITEIECDASEYIINEEEKVEIKEISYVHNRNPEFKAKATLLKNGMARLHLILEVDRSGQAFTKVIKQTEPVSNDERNESL